MASLDRPVVMGSGFAAAQRPGMTSRTYSHRAKVAAAIAAMLLLSGCHGSPNDVMFPGSLGHEPPPAINLPPQDAGMEYR